VKALRAFFFAAAAFAAAIAPHASPAQGGGSTVLKATLANGLRVVIVRNPIAAVVSTDMTYLVGSRDDPSDVPGMAHAQEHMMYRGTPNLPTAQLGTIATALGGNFNAQTGDTVTQYQFTVPAADLDAVLRIESDRMRDVLDAQPEWQNERGAIEQEVARDLSTPGRDFFQDVRALAFAGTGYAHDGVGTKAAFDQLTGPRIKQFWHRWYAPNNAVLVIAGDVDPQRTLAQVHERFDAIPRRDVPQHAHAQLRPLTRTVIRRSTSLTYPLAAIAYRMPGIESPDFLPSFVLQGILDSEEGPLHALEQNGEALSSDWNATPYLPEGQLSFALAALPPDGDPEAMGRRLESIVAEYAQHGVPRALFESTKRKLIAEQELSRNSIEALASDWSDTIAQDNEPSIAHEQELIAAVTLQQVNEVAKRSLDPRHAIVGALTPSAAESRGGPAAPSQLGRENPLAAKPVGGALPAWAQPLLRNPTVPRWTLNPTTVKLSNGMTLIVQPETISSSVFVYGRIRNNPALQEPAGREGVSAVLGGIFAFGTAQRDRAAFARALDQADASESGGFDFGLQTTQYGFERGVALLAENELHPRFDQQAFSIARQTASDQLATSLNAAHTIAMQRAEHRLLPAGDPALRQPSPSGINALTLDDVRSYYARTFRPDLTTIVVVGNVTPARARAAVEAGFGGWSASGDPPALELPALATNQPARVTLDVPISQDAVTLQELVNVKRGDPDVPALELGNTILGGGRVGPQQSRLFRDLRQNAGLVYVIDSSLATGRSRSRFTIEFACDPANETRIEQMVDGEVARMRTEPVGDFELGLMKASSVRQALVRQSAIPSIGAQLLEAATEGRPLDAARTDTAKLLGVDAAAIQRAFAAHIDPQRFVRVIEGPS
jgi:zinc protease